jgi:site-specific DNA recombinase
VKTYTDQFSGAYAERPALQEALRDARLGRFDILLVYRVDRFARSLKVLVGLLEELEHAGVAFRSATEPIDTASPTGRMLIQLLGVFAEFERATIIDRVVAGMERKAARGGWPGGSIPYGLRLDEEHHLAIEPVEFTTVKRIFARYGTDKAGGTTIATELNDEGLRTRSGRRWSAKVILGILRNRGYLGEVSFRDVVHQPDESLLDAKLFEKAQALLTKRGEGYARRQTDSHPEYLLTSLIECGHCHRHYVGAAATGNRYRYRYYVCWTRQRYGKGSCEGERIRADVLEEAVFAALIAVYGDPDLIERAIAAKEADGAESIRRHAGEVAATVAELRKTEAAIERYMHAFEAGNVTEEMFGTRVRELGDKARALRARESELAEAAEAIAMRAPTSDEIDSLRRELEVEILRGSGARRKMLAQGFVHRLLVVERGLIIPTFNIRHDLPPGGDDECGVDGGTGPEGQKVRAMTPKVEATGLEPANLLTAREIK